MTVAEVALAVDSKYILKCSDSRASDVEHLLLYSQNPVKGNALDHSALVFMSEYRAS